MRRRPRTGCRAAASAAGFVVIACGAASGAVPYIVADRTNDTIYRMADADRSGVIDEPGEVSVFFNAANAAGTLGPMNPTTMCARFDGMVVFGDQVNRNVYVLRDLNGDGDAQDAGESLVGADAANESGVSFAFPTGCGFDPLGIPYVVNAGNSFGDDGVYKLVDMNNDGDFQDAGEIITWVGPGNFGPGNGPFSPQEILFAPADVSALGYLRNSSADLHGVYRLFDDNIDGDADDPGEMTVFFDAMNASGIAVSAGFALELDQADGQSLYTLQIASGGVDQLIRLTDLNGDGDAQDAGEAVIVWTNSDSGFSAIDIVSREDGRVLITDASGDRVFMLRDLDNDGLFMSPGEAAAFFGNTTGVLADARQIAPLPRVAGPCPGDLDGDDDADTTDLNILLSDFGCDAAPGSGCRGDLDCDYDSDTTDLNILLSDFGCGP